MTTSEIITAFRDLAVAGAAIVSAGVAWSGLATWQRQMRGKEQYELARRLLKAAYRVRDALFRVRTQIDPALFVPEIPPDLHAEMVTDDFQEHLSVLAEAMRDLETEAVEAEVLWGQEIAECIKKVLGIPVYVFMFFELYTEAIRNPDKKSSEEREHYASAIYASPRDDAVAKNITEYIKDLEDKVRRYVGE